MRKENEKTAEAIDRYMNEAVQESCARLRFSSKVEEEQIEKLEKLTLFILEAAMSNIIFNCARLDIPPERGAMVFMESVAAWNRKIDEDADKRRRGGLN